MPSASFPQSHQFNPGTSFSSQAQQQSAAGSGMAKPGKLSELKLTPVALNAALASWSYDPTWVTSPGLNGMDKEPLKLVSKR